MSDTSHAAILARHISWAIIRELGEHPLVDSLKLAEIISDVLLSTEKKQVFELAQENPWRSDHG